MASSPLQKVLFFEKKNILIEIGVSWEFLFCLYVSQVFSMKNNAYLTKM